MQPIDSIGAYGYRASKDLVSEIDKIKFIT